MRFLQLILTALCLAFCVATVGYAAQLGADNSQQVNRSADRSTNNQQGNTAQAVPPGDLTQRENAVKPDCGTPKECRTEQREQHNLEAAQASAKASQISAEAAVSQRNAAWWQTGVGAAGVILLILTVIYTHVATRAAIDSVRVVALAEGPRPCIYHGLGICRSDGVESTIKLQVHNAGRTAGIIKETCVQGSATGLFADFKAENIKKHATSISVDETVEVDSFSFADSQFPFIVGYYELQSLFSKKPLRDYFCFELEDAIGPPDAHGKMVGSRKVNYRIDLDWPADESITV